MLAEVRHAEPPRQAPVRPSCSQEAVWELDTAAALLDEISP
jgi:hypothetical protein